MMNVEEEVSPHPKYFKQKFTSILNRKKSLREVYRNDVSKCMVEISVDLESEL